MKVRNGFVSNSSSSSFIIASEGDTLTATVKVDLRSLVRDVIKTEAELESYYIDEYGYHQTIDQVLVDNEWLFEQFVNARTAIRSGKTIYIGRVSNEDDGIGQYLYNYGFGDIEADDGFVVISTGD